jgi:Cu2+-exporting ATPase
MRKGMKKAIQDLKDIGIEPVLLSGDNTKITETIASELNIEKYKGGVLPADKGEYVKMLKEKGRIVAMAGDGINDAHALAETDIGIAMGSGTDIAIESAGITLMKSDIQHIHDAIFLSKATVKTIHQNLFWAFGYNILAIPIAAGVLFPFTGFLLNPMIAGAAMALSSVSVVINSLQLKKKKLT